MLSLEESEQSQKNGLEGSNNSLNLGSRSEEPDLRDSDDGSGPSRLTTPGIGSEPESDNPKTGSLLNVGKATKRNREESEEYDPENPIGIERERYKKRVPAKVIDRLWTRLEPDQFRSLDNLFTVAMNKTLQRYKGSTNEHYKVAEAQRVLSHHWTSDKLPKSFLARAKMTKLPPLKSLQMRMRGVKADSHDLLDIDQTNRKKALYEAYLLAEKQQLQELQTYYKSIKKAFDEDSRYLEEFKKTTAAIQAQNTKEIEEKKAQYHLDGLKQDDELGLGSGPAPIPKEFVQALFDPDEDPDVRELLEAVQSKMEEIAPREKLEELLQICDELDEFQSKFDDGRLFRPK